MTIGTLIIATLLAVTYPDPRITPGDTFPQVTAATVCVPGYTSTVRNVPLSVRQQVLRAYGYIGPASAIELDHLIPLELAGSNSAKNLWPQPIADAHVKDQDENFWHRETCAGRVTLHAAQAAMLSQYGPRRTELPLDGPLIGGKVPAHMPATGGGGMCASMGTWPKGHVGQVRSVSEAPGSRWLQWGCGDKATSNCHANTISDAAGNQPCQ